MRRSFVLPVLAAALAVGTGASVAADAPTTNSRSNDCATRDSRGGKLAVVGLTADGALVCFRDDRPKRLTTIAPISGLVEDTAVVGMDYRPANDALYAVGNAGGIYTVDVASGVATGVSRLTQPLEGSSFGVDFNPTVDRLRIISDTGQNLRVNVDDGSATVDGVLNIPGTPPVTPATGVTAAAYTNNDADPNTATTLFDIDTTNDTTVVQAPANAGSLSPTGKLGVDAAGPVGFDIYSELRNGTTVGLRALASIAAADGSTKLYRVDLLAGRTIPVGSFDRPVVDIAIPTAQR